MTTLTFRTWSREQIGALATSTSDGRARAQTAVTLTGTDASGATTTTETRTIAFLLAGPPDVAGLKPGAITSRYPAPGTIDAESDKASHVEFADPALPWRYSPETNPAAGSGSLQPWLALVVGVEETELTLRGDSVTLSQSLQQAHPIGGAVPFPWGHVQVDATGRRVSRLLSARPLDPGTDYLAVVVPAYSDTGALAWTGTGSVTLPVFDRWRFRTAQPAGSFRDLAAALSPGEADPATGRAPVDYPRVPDAPDLEIRGALAPVGSTVAALPTEVADDLAGLMTPATDEVGRPIVGLPRYGDAWVADPGVTSWGEELNGDPRHRGVAGVGLEMGIRLQDELVDEARAQAGALEVAAQRIADLVLGLEAGRSIWDRRLPSDPLRRLWVLGPALRRVVTDAGPVADLATADDRALPRGLFSSAARRVLRPGPARSAVAGGRAVDPAAILASANRCPVPPKPRDDGVAFDAAGVRDFEERRRRTVESGELDLSLLAEAVRSIDLDPGPDQLKDMLGALVGRIVSAAEQGAPAPYGESLALLFRALAVDHADEEAIARLHRELRVFVDRFGQLAEDPREFVDLLIDLEEPKGEERPCRPVDLDALAGVAGVFDPTAVDGPARVRVLSTIEGLDPAEPLAPPEVCIGLDRPVWRDVEGTFPEWLLPGVAALPQDSVIALETNPAFTDAVLAGYNTQLLGELRWRNIRVATGCTPLRVFWERANTSSGDRIDDIIGVLNWPAASDVGAASHRPGGASGTDLVLVFRGRLFLRYPKTLIYLVSARHGGTVDWDADPDPAGARILPSFQGRIGSDVTFFGFQGVAPSAAEDHWVVLEEPPTGYRFYNLDAEIEAPPPPNPDSAAFAAAMFADPVRVLIRGDVLVPEVTP